MKIITKNIKTVVLVIIASFIFTKITLSQEVKHENQGNDGMGYSIYGGNILDVEELNKKFKNKGYSKIPENFFCVGGGGHGIINNSWIIGGEG